MKKELATKWTKTLTISRVKTNGRFVTLTFKEKNALPEGQTITLPGYELWYSINSNQLNEQVENTGLVGLKLVLSRWKDTYKVDSAF